MTRNKFTCSLLCLTAISAMAINVEAMNIIWSGAAADQDIFNAANYAISFDPGTGTYGAAPSPGPTAVYNAANPVYAGSIQYNNAGTLTGFPAGFSGLSVDDAEAVCFNNTDIDALAGATGGLRNGTYELLNGSDATMQYVAALNSGTGTYYIDGTSTMTLAGGGNPINDGSGTPQLLLDAGASLTLTSLANFTTNSGNGAFIFFANPSGDVKSVNDHLADISGTTITDLANAGYGTLTGTTFTSTQAWSTPHVSSCPITIPVPEPTSVTFLSMVAAALIGLRYRR